MMYIFCNLPKHLLLYIAFLCFCLIKNHHRFTNHIVQINYFLICTYSTTLKGCLFAGDRRL
jgi:hypothetical protein